MSDQTLFLKLYDAPFNNAVNLITDAEILFERGRYCRAYALAFTALEEIGKSQLAADVFTDFICKKQFDGCFYSHNNDRGRQAVFVPNSGGSRSTDVY